MYVCDVVMKETWRLLLECHPIWELLCLEETTLNFQMSVNLVFVELVKTRIA